MITFAIPGWKYESYADFWRLVALSEFPTCYVDEMSLYDREAIYITTPMNGDFQNHLDNHRDRRCTIFLWMLERPGGSGTLAKFKADNQVHIDAGRVDAIICSDAGMMRDCGYHFVPMYSHPLLGIPGQQKQYDTIGLMAYAGRRGFLFADPKTPLPRLPNGCTQAPNAWGGARDLFLKQTRIGINVHQDEVSYCEPLRFALFSAYGLPIVSENIPDGHPYERGLIQSPLDKYLHWLDYARKNYDQLRLDGLALRDLMCYQNNFREGVEKWL